MSESTAANPDTARTLGRRILAASPLITLFALILALVHVIWPDLNIDTVTLVLLGIAIVPWLGHVIAEIELPGGVHVTYRDFQQLREQVKDQEFLIEENRGRSQSAITQAETAASLALSVQAPPLAGSESLSPNDRMHNLERRYDEIRETYKSGPQRTTKMTDVMGEMISLVPKVTDIDLIPALHGKGGERLAGYASLYALPNDAYLEDLVDSLGEREQGSSKRFLAQPFEQYWGLLALHKLLGQTDTRMVPQSIVTKLTELKDALPQGSDRSYELARCLELLGL